MAKGMHPTPMLDQLRAAVAELRHRSQATRQGQGLRRRPAGPARDVVPNAQGLLERRHGRRRSATAAA